MEASILPVIESAADIALMSRRHLNIEVSLVRAIFV